MAGKIKSYRDLEVYQKLYRLALDIYKLTHTFPKYETYELGSQLRRSSNSAPANLAEAWNNKHTNIYLEGINRSLGEIQETQHHLNMAFSRGYLDKAEFEDLLKRYEETAKMLRGLQRSLMK